MKKTIILLFFIALSGISHAQQPIDSLYLWVNFQEENIVIDIPSEYFTLRTIVPQLPRFVAVRKLNMLVPPLPGKEKLLQSFATYFGKAAPSNNNQRLDWLRVMALYIYFSHNDLSKLQPEVLTTLENWQTAPETKGIQPEVGMVMEYLQTRL
ncbi:MAG: hypothetical protein RBS07_13695 [Lentimicrobium sp.]|jgi:hypothetical protein|nr:hypothetical protein [Lentimicrobium sp.]